MKLSWYWLGQHVDTTGLDPRRLANSFTMSVAELDGVEELGVGTELVLAARITRLAPHPEADRLQLADCETGGGRTSVIVTGAPNVRVGMVTALALPGAVLPAGVVEGRLFKGIESLGVFCSERDLGISDEHDGVLELPGDVQPGTRVGEFLPLHDFIWDMDNKSITHRPDLWCHRGIARELAALTGRKLKPTELAAVDGGGPALQVEVRDQALCPRYCALPLGGVSVAPSPLWLKLLLYRVGVRPISNLVDLTNYVMMDLGNPLHAFDARQIKGGIVVRRAGAGELMKTLDGVERSLTDQDLVIADHERPVALAGVMGGENSEILPDTADMVLESACFKASGVRKTSARLGLRSESSMRFEKALDMYLPEETARRFFFFLKQLCPGARQTGAFVDVRAEFPAAKYVDTKYSFINRKLGTSLGNDRIRTILEALSFEPGGAGDELRVKVPVYRATRDIGIEEDLVEEVGRMVGFDNIEPQPPMAAVQPPVRPASRLFDRQLRQYLALECRALEVMLYSFDSTAWCRTIGHDLDGTLRLRNPISSDMVSMRRSLLPNMLAAALHNQTSYEEQRFFELGRVFFAARPGDEVPPQERHVAWMSVQKKGEALELFRQTRGVLDGLLSDLRVGGFRLEAAEPPANMPWAVSGRFLQILDASGTAIGYLSQVNPFVLSQAKIRGVAVCFDLNLEPLYGKTKLQGKYTPLPRFPRISYDLSFVVESAVQHRSIEQAILGAAGGLLKELEFVAFFEGAPIPDGKRSLSYRLVFGDDSRTLREEDVKPAVAAVVQAVKDACGGVLRE